MPNLNYRKPTHKGRNKNPNKGGAQTRSKEQQHAYDQVKAARKSGKLKKPATCEYPGCSKPATEADHRDYKNPLDVTWYCAEHNRESGAGKNRGKQRSKIEW